MMYFGQRQTVTGRCISSVVILFTNRTFAYKQDKKEWKNNPDAPKIERGLILMVRKGSPIVIHALRKHVRAIYCNISRL